MSPILGALIPVFALIAAGYLLRRIGFPGAAFWAPAERLTYFVFFPALLVYNLSRAPLAGQPTAHLAGALALAVVAVSIGLLVLHRVVGFAGPAFTSLFQGSIRFNSYVGIAAAVALHGALGLTLAAITLAVLIPLVNVLCVAVLTRFGAHGGANGVRATAGAVLRNPLVLACITGAAINLSGLGMPQPLDGVLLVLGHAALPVGLLAVGAGLNLRAMRHARITLVIGSLIKLVAMPLVVWAACRLLQVPPLASAVAVLFGALPGATSAYILARQLGGDHELIAGMITLQTAAAAVTLPVALLWLAR